MTIRPKGLNLRVLRTAGPDCTRNGITSRHDTLVLVGINDETCPTRNPRNSLVPATCRVSAADEDDAVVLNIRQLRHGRTLCLVPAVHDGLNWRPASGWHMAGGNYAATSDSRFGELLRAHGLSTGYVALSVHDRRED